MPSTWNWIILNLIIYVNTLPLESETKAFLELTELDYEDACYNAANAQWLFIISPSNETLSTWEIEQHKYAKFKKIQKAEVLGVTVGNTNRVLEPSLQYKYNMVEKPGDALLKDEDWTKFIHFIGIMELLHQSNYTHQSQNYSRKDVEYLLSHKNIIDDKRIAWSTWYERFTPLMANFSNNILLVAQAAKENDAKNIEEYWETLSGYSNGYDKIKSEWSRINNLHKKIVKFIGINLSQKYKITINDTIPAYLLGNLQGYDWTDLSADTLPHSDIIYEIKKNLWRKKFVGKSLYKTASSLGSLLFKQVPQAEFWDKSEFNGQCPSRLLNFCKDGTMRVSTCSKATISNFLTAHKNVGKILFNQMAIESTPVLNTVNRYSGLEEGVSTLFGILSASPAWLNHTYLLNNVSDNDQRLIVSLMITALNVLPELAYYYSVDMWRIHIIKENITNPTDIMSSWWKHRQEYEGISFIDMDVPTFLDDDYIISNKPYLSKILGIILAFQLYEYTMDSTEVRYDSIDGKLNGNIIKMILRGGSHNWPDALDKFLDVDDISVDALISYFTRLEEFIEVFIEEDEEQFEYKPRMIEEKELEELEKQVLLEINSPTTTSSPISVTSTRKTKILSNTKNSQIQSNIEKSVESKSTVNIRENKAENSDLLESKSPEISFDKPLETLDDKQNKPKISTSKAIWAVSAILIAIITISVIALFGRQRCRKTPKNRR